MIKAGFFTDKSGRIHGFRISGHSMFADAGEDVVCAFVSSAAFMTANTVTDIMKAKAEAQASDGLMTLSISEDDVDRCQDILEGLKLHLEQTEEQYPKNLKVITTEV